MKIVFLSVENTLRKFLNPVKVNAFKSVFVHFKTPWLIFTAYDCMLTQLTLHIIRDIMHSSTMPPPTMGYANHKGE